MGIVGGMGFLIVAETLAFGLAMFIRLGCLVAGTILPLGLAMYKGLWLGCRVVETTELLLPLAIVGG